MARKEWDGKVNFIGKNGQVVLSQGVSLDIPLAELGIPGGIGGSVGSEQKIGNGEIEVKKSSDVGVSAAGVAAKISREVEGEGDNKKTTIKGTVGSAGAFGAGAVIDYNLEIGTKVESKKK